MLNIMSKNDKNIFDCDLDDDKSVDEFSDMSNPRLPPAPYLISPSISQIQLRSQWIADIMTYHAIYEIQLSHRVKELNEKIKEVNDEHRSLQKEHIDMIIAGNISRKRPRDEPVQEQPKEKRVKISFADQERRKKPEDYKHMKKEDMESKILRIFKKLKTIEDIINLEKLPEKYDYMANVKFLKLYDTIPSLKRLDRMVGMVKVKQYIFQLLSYFVQNLQDNNEMLHLVITGSPGVGKTELGKILSGIYYGLGFVDNDEVIIAKRSDLIGEYLGQTAVKTQKVIDSAEGRMLIIDEAYSLGNSEKRDSFSKECIDTINLNLSKTEKNFKCAIIGYREALERCFFSYNPGLERRFPYRFHIDDYDYKELAEIFMRKVNEEKWKLSKDVKILEYFRKYHRKFKYFGGDVEIILQRAKFQYSLRCLRTTLDIRDLSRELNLSDLEKAYEDFKKAKDEGKEPIDPSIANLYI
jgi:SpoVK/Ycf46/Vps4 family AAA+-type ATPase